MPKCDVNVADLSGLDGGDEGEHARSYAIAESVELSENVPDELSNRVTELVL